MTRSKRKLTLNKWLTRTSWVGLFGLLLAGAQVSLVHAARTSQDAKRNIIQSLKVEVNGDQTRLVLQGSRTANYSTFILDAPTRLVLDLQQADVSKLRRSRLFRRGLIRTVKVQQFSNKQLHIGRLIVGLAPKAKWQIDRQGDRLVIAFQTRSTRASVQRRSRSNVVSRTGRREGIRGRRARRLLGLKVKSKQIALRTDGAIKGYELIELRKPARLVLDLYKLKRARFRSIRRALKRVSCAKGAFKRVRIGRHPNKLRVVLDACAGHTLPKYDVRLLRRGMLLTPRKVVKQADATPIEVVGPQQPQEQKATIADIGFGETATHSQVFLRTTGKISQMSRTQQGNTVKLLLRNASLAKGLRRQLDTTEFRGAVRSIQVTNQGKDVAVSVALRQHVSHQIKAYKGGYKWQFAMPTRAKQLAASSYRIKYHPQRVGQAGTGMSAGDLALMEQRKGPKRYTGRRISIFFRKVEIHNLLRLFTEISGMNIITSDKVKGRITLKLRNVPWDQALDLVLKTLKLGMEKSGNIARIATLEELRQEEQQRRKLQQLKLLAQPQKIRLIPVNYAKAQLMAQKVKTILSPRGKVSIDTRTNVLIVKDYVPFLLRAEGLVRSLDTQTPQVLIQARIVEANVNFSQEFGIQWGGHLLFSPLTGNSTGLQFPNPFAVRGGVPATAGGGAPQLGQGDFGTPNYIVNFPATTGLNNGTALSFLFGSLSGVGSLNMRLSAAESTGNVKIISAPKIITLHNMQASIQQGLQIPFSSASAAGTNVQFVTASLSLSVQPQVTTDGSVFLQLQIANNAPDFSKGGAAGPAITTKTANTNMLIKDGETMVIGGIYSRRTGESQSRIPFLSQIPVLGLLFKNYRYNDDRAELLVFVTPRIINRAKTLGGRQGS